MNKPLNRVNLHSLHYENLSGFSVDTLTAFKPRRVDLDDIAMGVSGELGAFPRVAFDLATQVVHGSVPVERSGLQARRVIDRRYGLLAHEGSMPECADQKPWHSCTAVSA